MQEIGTGRVSSRCQMCSHGRLCHATKQWYHDHSCYGCFHFVRFPRRCDIERDQIGTRLSFEAGVNSCLPAAIANGVSSVDVNGASWRKLVNASACYSRTACPLALARVLSSSWSSLAHFTDPKTAKTYLHRFVSKPCGLKDPVVTCP